jgi:TPR repeat protein
MDYQLKTHCPNCFKSSNTDVCASCHFDQAVYFKHHAAIHHLPVFTELEKGYVIGRVLGESNFAIVYAGIRKKDQLSCAIKEYFPRDLAQRHLDNCTVKPKYTQGQLTLWQNRFVQEAELLRSCYDHPSVESGVVHYTALINQHNTAYLVMERLTGMRLSDYLTQQMQLSPAKVWIWLKPLLETLQKLHAKDIYHREISPNNIFLIAPDTPVLMDFGLGRAGAREERLKFSTLSSNNCIAPEQLTSDYLDLRTDLYGVGAIIYWCLHGEAPPSIEARQQGAVLKPLNSADKAAQALQTAAVHCLQLNVNLRPKNIEHLLAELTSSSTSQVKVKTDAGLDVIPVRSNPRPNHAKNPHPTPVLTKPHSFFHTLVVFLASIAVFFGLAYGGFIAFEKYDAVESEHRKQDNLLFSQAKSLADYKNYLTSCVTCENKERAMERVAQLAQEQQTQLSQQKQQEQEALLFSKAQSAEDFKRYLTTCKLCTDKQKAEEKLAQVNNALKEADEKQLAEQAKALAEALNTKSSLTDFSQQNCPQNIQLWQRAADQSNVLAQFFLGSCYRSGSGVKQDDVEAMKWYSKAAAQDNVYAQNSLGEMYQKGYGAAQNDKEAAKWYRRAAEQGQAKAQYALGAMYEYGQGLDQDYKQAVDWYLRSAEQGNADAQYSLGGLYHYGSGVEQDYQEALKWYRKSAEKNNDKAQYLMGVMYEQGYGVQVNPQKALSWYQKAAQQGNVDAIAQMKGLEVTATDSSNKLPELPENLNEQPLSNPF